MRKRLYEIIEVSQENDKAGMTYDVLMMCAIIISIIPLAFKETNVVFLCTDIITTVLFIIDYILRIATADYKLPKKGGAAFFLYPFTPWAIIDLVSILPGLPGLSMLNDGFKLLRLFRMFRTLRVFRVFKALRYSKSVVIIINVIKKSKEALLAVCTLAAGYILISALIVFNVEEETFRTYFDAVYWATVSLTTVGYGDIYPVSTAGRIITMFSSMFGIAIVALPAGIITAGYMEGLTSTKEDNK